MTCLLCIAERITPWYHEDDDCWIAECSICAVPMVVWKSHDPEPPAAVKAELHDRLARVVVDHFGFDHWVDDDMRRIPDHYHAHARPVGGFFGHGLSRRPVRTCSGTEPSAPTAPTDRDGLGAAAGGFRGSAG